MGSVVQSACSAFATRAASPETSYSLQPSLPLAMVLPSGSIRMAMAMIRPIGVKIIAGKLKPHGTVMESTGRKPDMVHEPM